MGACHVHWPRKVVALMRVGSVVTWTILFVLSLCTLKPPFVLTDTSVLPTVCFLLSSLDDLRCSDTVGGEIEQNGTSTADNSLLAKTLPQFASRAPVFVFIRATNCSLATSTLQDSYLDKVRTFFPSLCSHRTVLGTHITPFMYRRWMLHCARRWKGAR